ncbi:MAG: bifunctional (p)ppGpp synthetase/guanosine-3',5'-bis(diphosphate) 3'-pyrophosphohydrolase [Acidobacteriota bacterium]
MTTLRDTLPPPVQARKGINFESILQRLDDHGRPYSRDVLSEVYAFTERMHRDQTRRSGEPYITHPVYVAYLLADLKFDATSVAVGLLHDVLEDTLTTKESLAESFGGDVAELVDGVTKIGRQAYVKRDEAQAETFRKMILASARDIRVITVKLADRLHNMMTLEHMAPEKRRRISRETLEIYAPIARRLGMARVQGDLEDLAFFFLYPHQYAELDEKVREKLRVSKDAIDRIHGILRKRLGAAGIDAEISYRVKRPYSIFRKLHRQDIDLDQLYDYLAFRIITADLKDTYAAFGIVHQTWRPLPGRFKDYIAMPKPNLYQSLHTTVLGDGQPFEVQIRTREMDAVAEEGIAAHWRYKEGKGGGVNGGGGDTGILWLRQLLEWQQEVQDPRTFLHQLKIDLYPEEVYVFTPRGEVYSFPRGATPLDFAYRIHTDLGHQCSGARVNGRLVPLKTKLQNGDMVEIMSSPSRRPSRDWLSHVATSRARSKIRHWLNQQQKREAEGIGKRLLEKELRRLRLSLRRVVESDDMASYLQAEGLARIEDLYQRLGYGKIAVRQVIDRLTGDDAEGRVAKQAASGPIRRVVERLLAPSASGPITVKGENDLMASLAKCCNPVPGEAIIGYITRGRGVSIHASDCPNVRNLMYDPERIIEVEWAKESEESVYAVGLSVHTQDHPGILARLTEVIAKEQGNIKLCKATTVETGHGLIEFVLEVRNHGHLNKIRASMQTVSGVIDVQRRMHGSRADEGMYNSLD